MQWIPSEKKEQSDALFDGQVTDVYLIDGHALPPSAIHEALARPEQELVAWMDEYGDVLSASVVDGNGLRNIPLYTTPPQRKWVGLTDEQIDEIYFKSSLEVNNRCEDIYDFARAIESKLREKNT